MKYIKTFEDIEDLDVFAYRYLDKADEELIEVYIRDYLRNEDIFKKINKLNYNYFDRCNFDCYAAFEELITGMYNSLSAYSPSKNIYYYIDTKIKDIKGRFGTVELRNSMQKILEKIYEKSIKEKIDKKLISILETNPDRYSEIYENYFEELNDEVKKACSWMLGYKKFNL